MVPTKLVLHFGVERSCGVLHRGHFKHSGKLGLFESPALCQNFSFPLLSPPLSLSFSSFFQKQPACLLPSSPRCIRYVAMGNTTHSGLLLFRVVQPSHLRWRDQRAKGVCWNDEIMVLLSVSCCGGGFMFHLRPGPLWWCFYMLRTTPLKNTARLLKGFSCNATGLSHFFPIPPKEP